MRILRYIPLFLLLTLWSCQDEFPIKGTVGSMEELTPSKYSLTPYMSLMAQSGEAHEMQASITHNTSWIITGLPSWLTITPSQGTGEGPTFVTIAFAENTTGDVRSCKFYLKSNDGKVSVPIEASQFSTTSSQTTEDISNFCPDNNHPHQIDLGLSVKWTCCNVGASSPADYGGYYAWGETAEKVNYTWTTYKWCGGSDKSMTKYCTSSYYGTVDDKTVLEASDDAATVNWGSSYRTPTSDELTELKDYCTWTWVTIGGVPGHKVTGSTGNSIFLPAGGSRADTRMILKDEYGLYWSSTLGDVYPAGAQQLGFTSDKPYRNGSDRYSGHNIRPVVGEATAPDPLGLCPDNNHPHQIDLGLSVKWTCCNVGASSPADYGGYYAWGETATKGNYEWETYKWCNGRYDTMSKYCTDSELGTVDNLTQLEMSDDAARVYMGSPYRMPTIEELTELNENCTWVWTTINNVYGYKVTASNGNSIFLPVAGERSGNGSGMTDDGIYMSSSLYTSTPFQARVLSFADYYHITTGREYRYYGMSVRPVVGGTADPDPLGLCPDNNHPHQIDLGLNVKWACCNVGATSPIQYGGYYAWGETSEKTNYTWTTYKWCNGTSNTLTRYCTDASYGTVDTRTTLLTADDAATANLSTGWRTPSQTEWTQIRSKCTWTWTTKSGVAGCLVTGTNGNSIFLPAAGSRVESGAIDAGSKGNYWVNSLSYSPETAEIIEFDADGKRSEVCGRIDGHTVRAVAK